MRFFGTVRVAAAALALLGAAPALAQNAPQAPANEGDVLTRALAAVSARLPATSGDSGVLGRGDPAMRADLDALERAGQMLGTEALPTADFSRYGGHCVQLAQLTSFFLNDGVGRLPQAQQEARVVSNMRRFQDELAMLLDITLQCNATYLAELPAYMRRLPDEAQRRRHGEIVGQIRYGLRFTLIGMAGTATDPVYSAANRARFARGVSHWGTMLFAHYPVAERDSIAQEMLPLLSQWSGPDAVNAARVAAVLASRECEALCQIP
jgi:hypothetical protein